jgi:hypothetical protein
MFLCPSEKFKQMQPLGIIPDSFNDVVTVPYGF